MSVISLRVIMVVFICFWQGWGVVLMCLHSFCLHQVAFFCLFSNLPFISETGLNHPNPWLSVPLVSILTFAMAFYDGNFKDQILLKNYLREYSLVINQLTAKLRPYGERDILWLYISRMHQASLPRTHNRIWDANLTLSDRNYSHIIPKFAGVTK